MIGTKWCPDCGPAAPVSTDRDAARRGCGRVSGSRKRETGERVDILDVVGDSCRGTGLPLWIARAVYSEARAVALERKVRVAAAACDVPASQVELARVLAPRLILGPRGSVARSTSMTSAVAIAIACKHSGTLVKVDDLAAAAGCSIANMRKVLDRANARARGRASEPGRARVIPC